jgi:hypothetical protein
MNTQTTSPLRQIVTAALETVERDLRTMLAEQIAPRPVAEPVPAPAPRMTAAEYLAEREGLDEWAAYYRATDNAEGLRNVWAARKDLADRYRGRR